jgi:hypothetical protein
VVAEVKPLVQTMVDPSGQAGDGVSVPLGPGETQPGRRVGQGRIDLGHRISGDQHLQRIEHDDHPSTISLRMLFEGRND